MHQPQSTVNKRLQRNPLTAVRLQIKQGGYDVIPLFLDKKPMKGWPAQPNGEADIAQWNGCATGVRLYRSPALFCIDLDIRIREVCNKIGRAYQARWGAFMAGCLKRHSEATTIMLIGRCSTAKGARRSGRWHRDANDSKGNLVEIFTANCKRFVGVQGMHSIEPDRSYAYIGRAIWDTPITKLPWFPDQDIDAALAIADEIMEAHGLEQRTPPLRPTRASERAFDLEPTMQITLSTGEEMSLTELEDRIKVNQWAAARTNPPMPPERITAFALWDPTSTTPDRVLVGTSATGLTLWDTKTGISHRWKNRGGHAEDLTALIASIMALRSEVLS